MCVYLCVYICIYIYIYVYISLRRRAPPRTERLLLRDACHPSRALYSCPWPSSLIRFVTFVSFYTLSFSSTSTSLVVCVLSFAPSLWTPVVIFLRVTSQGPFVGSKEGLRVAVCCSVLQCVAVCCSAFMFTPQGPFVGSKEGLRVAVCCSVLQCVAVHSRSLLGVPSWVIKRGCVLQCVAVCCSVLQCVAVHSRSLLRVPS